MQRLCAENVPANERDTRRGLQQLVYERLKAASYGEIVKHNELETLTGLTRRELSQSWVVRTPLARLKRERRHFKRSKEGFTRISHHGAAESYTDLGCRLLSGAAHETISKFRTIDLDQVDEETRKQIMMMLVLSEKIVRGVARISNVM